jgi:hypothetical protein
MADKEVTNHIRCRETSHSQVAAASKGNLQQNSTTHERCVMAEQPLSLSSLRLNVEEREKVADIAGDLIAVQVYRELQLANQRLIAADSSGCNIIGNCSSSSKSALLLGQ